MNKREFKKPDGRRLWIYSQRPISDQIVPTNPPHDQKARTEGPHMRWHPLRGEWVAYASHRQNRTFLPPKDYSPLAVTRSPDFPTEMPAGDYDVAVFDNLFPSLEETSKAKPEHYVPTSPANGACEVVVFTQDPDTSLAALSVEKIDTILEVLGDRTREIGSRENLRYVLPFENRGVEVGVTLHHPHGQIYAYPFVPPVPAMMTALMEEHYAKTGHGLLSEMLENERKDGRRLVYEERSTTAFIPVCARYPYETWVVPQRPVPYIYEMTPEERRDFARVLKTVLMKFDALWNKPFPYLMTFYQSPTDGKPHPEGHFHVQFYPPLRTRDRLKFLAGTELGAGMFVNDALPEEKAAELRAVQLNRSPELSV